MNAPDRCLVRKVKVIKEPGAIPRDMEWVFVPLEVIVRHYLSGSAWRRFQRGELTAEALGVAPDCEYGVKLSQPFVEVTTKFETFDRNIGREEALEISNITDEEYEKIVAAALAIDEIIEREAAKNGLIHVDGKKEFALGTNREVVLVDTFGTLDEDRWWDAEAYANGECIELSKEFVRSHYIETGHQANLQTARDAGTEEPPIPAFHNRSSTKQQRSTLNVRAPDIAGFLSQRCVRSARPTLRRSAALRSVVKCLATSATPPSNGSS